MDEPWDVIVVGGGPAGLSAALMLGRAGRRVLVLDAGSPRNRFAAHMHGVLGHEGIEPGELLRRGRAEVEAYGVEVARDSVHSLTAHDAGVEVVTDDRGILRTRALVLATGLTDDLPDLPGLREHWGSGVLHCPYCHGWEVRDSRIGVLALSPLVLHQAELLLQWTDRLTFFSAGAGPLPPEAVARLRARGVEIVTSPVIEVLGESGRLAGVRLEDGREAGLDAIFTGPPLRPHDQLVAHLELTRTDTPVGSFLAVDPTGRTSHPRIWAVGNVVNPMANVPMSMGAGATTGAGVNAGLVAEELDRAQAAPDLDPDQDPAAFWEERYSGSDQVWSGRVNATTADAVARLPVGDALDLGCGEGGDAVWMAEQGWRVTAVDISATAVARGAAGAGRHGVVDRVTWVAHDLGTWATEQTFDLVTASFLHSPVAFERTSVIARAADRVRSGGHLLVVAHVIESEADVPPWAWHEEQDADGGPPPSPPLMARDDPATLGLDLTEWSVERNEVVARHATGPDGVQTATVRDGLLLLQRV